MGKIHLPREHGAYAQLGFPLLSGLLLGSPGAAAWLFVAAAFLLFVAMSIRKLARERARIAPERRVSTPTEPSEEVNQ